jgi:hypothetical protein
MATVRLDPVERGVGYVGAAAASLDTVGSELCRIDAMDSAAKAGVDVVNGSGITAGPIGISGTAGCVDACAAVEPSGLASDAGFVGGYSATGSSTGIAGNGRTASSGNVAAFDDAGSVAAAGAAIGSILSSRWTEASATVS